MSNEESPAQKTFTVESANAALPLVRSIARDLAELSRDVLERRERLAQLLAGHDGKPSDLYHDELIAAQEDLERDMEQLGGYVAELEQLGVEPKNAPEGLIDFPAIMDGRLVYLCWKLGEPEVLYWHELDAGFRGRQPLAAGTTAGDGDDAELDGATLDS